MRAALAMLVVLLVADAARSQGQFPPVEEERILPHLETIAPWPALADYDSADMAARALWRLPLGTRLRFTHDRLIVAHSTKYALGSGPVLANQFLHLAPSGQERVLPKETVYTLVSIRGVHAKATYSAHLLRARHLVQMVLRADQGQVLELEICPGGEVTPTVAQCAPYLEIVELPQRETIE